MQHFINAVTRFSWGLDKIAGVGLVLMMVLVVGNILLRTLFKNPILGTVEYVGFLASFIISLALANCALKNGHVAVDLFIEKTPKKIQGIIDSLMSILILYYMSLFTWQMWIYAGSFVISGEVSATTRTPFYPFVYVVAIGLLALTLTLIIRFLQSARKVVRD